jgi:multicomponent Na+:H+ antiporter subunit C
MTAQFLYGGAGVLLFVLGIWSFLVHAPLVRKLIALNIMGGGVFHVLIAVAYRGSELPPDPVPHALVLTGIVVAVSATALALSMGRRLDEANGDDPASTKDSDEELTAGVAKLAPGTPANGD